jgi:cytochrome c5
MKFMITGLVLGFLSMAVAADGTDSAPADTTAMAPLADFDAEAKYQQTCFACHGTGAAGAPKLGDAAAWAPRIEKGMDVLYTSAIDGLNGTMPAKGICMDCSDDELKLLVDYMVEKSK